jgi:hypothetical protein
VGIAEFSVGGPPGDDDLLLLIRQIDAVAHRLNHLRSLNITKVLIPPM